MAYVTMERTDGIRGQLRALASAWDHPQSRSMIYPPNRARVAQAQQAAGSWADIQPYGASTGAASLRRLGYRGLGTGEEGGALSNVPQWAWWAGGGLVAGLVAGWLFVK